MAAGGLKNVSFYLVLLVLLAVVLECMAALVLRLYPDIEHTRDYLRGKTQQQLSMNSVAQPYLLYIPAPGYVDPKTGIQQNNADGYRGDVVPLQRENNTFRVLFLGGSTTYGEGVERPEEAYPARLGELLQQDPAFVGKKVEVINAGLRFGTTAEIITHYLLKFRYYKPDAVIINPGGNDPVAYLFSSYQPDYSHWRKQAPYLKALPKHAAWLMESRTLSIPIVLLFFF